ncbi:hypothetical protein [Hyphomicrobium sp.]|uniref:hypothetical protein n=1 Tax=Hyphomicrobium sp. TaxID=82 RepID=UPI002BFFC4FD|nr:hypothetical protein [Hyphomicrobium sp.]HRQ25808.1 hypothetical protein [Hyphomicrobium sp.]
MSQDEYEDDDFDYFEAGRGNVAAMEHLLGVLFSEIAKINRDPQNWTSELLMKASKDIEATDVLSAGERAAAQGTVNRVLMVATAKLDAAGHPIASH